MAFQKCKVLWVSDMPNATAFDSITHDPAVMGGKACIRGLRVTVRKIVNLVAAGRSVNEILTLYPYLTKEDVRTALAYAAIGLDQTEG
jgi:uncharacterized protein (DUF433 family)